ncbi:thioesterase II family protein [Streptomyces huiliensis]|uniref:thioesterase II family protein n=1 Tax=Streptomyces huiliensis TaxID=2876027 RepID=UPI001CBC6C39|nr:thioesterase domain-containing protein [Streptomyces huiliensis]
MTGRHPARARLFCFHHAGAGVSCFARWQRVWGDAAEVVPVLLPGRESRAREPRVTAPGPLLAHLVERLDPLLDRPFAFYGHSLGGLVAAALAEELRASGRRLPERLVLGAVPPPHRPGPLAPGEAARLPEPVLLERLRTLGMLPGLALDARAGALWRRTVLPVLRDDFRLAEALRARPAGPLPVPVLALAGRADAVVPVPWAGEWQRYAPEGFTLRTVPGDHFFVREPALPRLLLAELAALLREPAAAAGGLRSGSSRV